MEELDITKEIVEIKHDVTTLKRVVFGDKNTDEKGMKEKVDDIHTILTQSRGVISFFGGVRGMLGFIITVGAVIAYFKGWLPK